MILVSIKESTHIDTNFAIIKLTHGMTAIVDPEDFEYLNQFAWQARKSYSRYYAMRKVVTNGHEHWIRMHREIWKTPNGQIGHHKNRQTLDNRKSNGENMTQKIHQQIHINKMPQQIKHT